MVQKEEDLLKNLEEISQDAQIHSHDEEKG